MFYLASTPVTIHNKKVINLVNDKCICPDINPTYLDYTDKESINKTNFDDFDTMILHGGYMLKVWNDIINSGLSDIIRDFCLNKTFVGISAGAMIFGAKSFFIKGIDDIVETDLDLQLLCISKLRIHPHFNWYRNDPSYMSSLMEASRKIPDEKIYLLDDDAFIIDDVRMQGGVHVLARGTLTENIFSIK